MIIFDNEHFNSNTCLWCVVYVYTSINYIEKVGINYVTRCK
ncbi:hypothetical protein BN1321_130037 [Staphylococcus aureus]|uniref:Uncharacterized protein n=1 Tax=Staphylococcus aureus TaxID=1280 RepID=A0A0U1MGF3_STAAU|nr:hypothetical protein BN1321_130037 [Staphylococcus aureus]